MDLIIIITVLVVLAVLYLVWINRPGKCASKARLDGKVAIVTGANTGIGKATANDFAARGATVVIGCRNMEKGQKAAEEIRGKTQSTLVHVRQLDLSSLKSVREFVAGFTKDFPALHLLVNNAGVMMCPYALTEDGFESQMGINHFGHFVLTNLLLPTLKKSSPSRVINVSSHATSLMPYMNLDDLLWKHTKYHKVKAYSQSKLANILFTRELHQKLRGTAILVFSLHPGFAATNLLRYNPLLEKFFFIWKLPGMHFFVKTVENGAQTSIYCAVTEGLEELSGEYFMDCRHVRPAKMSYDVVLAKKLWKQSEEMTATPFPFS